MSLDSKALAIVEDALSVEDRDERSRLVVRACGGDAALLARVEELLSHDNDRFRLTATESFMRPMSVVDVIPDRIGPYRVTGEIARGGMGAVVKAERDDGVFERQVAIKLIRGDLASERSKARFADERRILARLSHPGIVRILDGGEVDNRPWLAMDFIDGLPVTQALEQTSHDIRLDAFEAICEAVAYAHRNLIVHADIKPSNVLMDSDGAVHLLDFGIARLISDLDEYESGDPYPLTKGYAAPERAVGVAPTIASDVFSLGVLLLGIFGRRVPGDRVECVPGTRLPVGELEGDLAAIAAKALSEAPEARYPDVSALLADMRRFRASEPVEARGVAGWQYRAARFVRRHRSGLALTAIAGAVLLATSVVSTVSYYRAERALAEADKRFIELRSLAQFMLTELSDRMSDAPGTLPARARLAEVAGRYLDRLRAVPNAPLDLRLDTARGYIRLARLQGLSGTANLGQPVKAAQSLDHAQAILDELDPAKAAVSTALGEVALARWSLASDTRGIGWTAKAEDYFARALKADHGDKAALLGSMTVRKNKGFDLITADNPAQALPVLQKTLADLRSVHWPKELARDAKLLEVNLLARIGDATYYRGDVSGALVPYRESAALIRAELARAPSLMWEEKLGEAAWNISGTLGEISGYEGEALAEANKGIAALNRTLAFGPDAALEKRLVILLGQQALLLDDMGRTADAVSASTQGISFRRKWLAEAPGDPNRQRDVAVALAAHSDLLAKSGNLSAACSEAQQGTQLLERMRQSGNLSNRDAHIDVPKLADAVRRHCR